MIRLFMELIGSLTNWLEQKVKNNDKKNDSPNLKKFKFCKFIKNFSKNKPIFFFNWIFIIGG